MGPEFPWPLGGVSDCGPPYVVNTDWEAACCLSVQPHYRDRRRTQKAMQIENCLAVFFILTKSALQVPPFCPA